MTSMRKSHRRDLVSVMAKPRLGSLIRMGYGIIALTVIGVVLHIVAHARLPLKLNVIEYGGYAFFGALGLFSILVGRKLVRLQDGLDRLDDRGFWAMLIRMRAYKVLLPLGCFFMLCGGVPLVANFFFDAHLFPNTAVLVSILETFVTVVGAFLFLFARGIRRIEDRINELAT